MWWPPGTIGVILHTPENKKGTTLICGCTPAVSRIVTSRGFIVAIDASAGIYTRLTKLVNNNLSQEALVPTSLRLGAVHSQLTHPRFAYRCVHVPSHSSLLLTQVIMKKVRLMSPSKSALRLRQHSIVMGKGMERAQFGQRKLKAKGFTDPRRSMPVSDAIYKEWIAGLKAQGLVNHLNTLKNALQ